jgi:2-acylglycerol O-acyltransferase 2
VAKPELKWANTIVGRPIIVKQNQNPSNEELHEYQKQYIDELMRWVALGVETQAIETEHALCRRSIWNRYKDVYARNRTRELRLVE